MYAVSTLVTVVVVVVRDKSNGLVCAEPTRGRHVRSAKRPPHAHADKCSQHCTGRRRKNKSYLRHGHDVAFRPNTTHASTRECSRSDRERQHKSLHCKPTIGNNATSSSSQQTLYILEQIFALENPSNVSIRIKKMENDTYPSCLHALHHIVHLADLRSGIDPIGSDVARFRGLRC